MKRLTLISLLALSTTLAWAGSDTGADFLKIPVGARAVALGQAYTAAAQGVNSLNWNPAGIANFSSYANGSKAGFAYSHQELFLGSSLDNVGFVVPNWGFSITRLSQPDQEGRAEDGSPTGSFGASDLAVGGAYATNVRGIRLGTHVKFIRQELAEFTAQGVAVDFGFLSKTPISRLSLGGAVRNLGPKMKFVQEDFNLPLTISVGALYNITGPLLIGFDVYSRPYQDQVSFSMGTEFQALQSITLRAGYLTHLAQAITNNQEVETDRGNFAGLNGLTAGLGLKLNNFSLDYALSQFGELGLTHSFTVGTFFGGQRTSRTPLVFANPNVDFFDEPEIKVVENGPDLDRTIVIFLMSPSDGNWWKNLRN